MANRVGQQFGNYRLIRLLEMRGYAEVYLGEHIHLGTQVAIEVLAYDQIDRFRNEARILAKLAHPNIVHVLDFGVEDNTPFLVKTYAPNGTLRQQHPGGTPLPITTILPYVKQIASALQYAHDQGFVHRDVKPANLRLGRNNEVLLDEFGLAIVVESSEEEQLFAGTPPYMAPEQIQGKPCFASDQYALGIVVYEWLCGTRPFSGSDVMQLVYQHMSNPPLPLREKIPTISPLVEQVVLTALAKDPQKRFASVKAFANAFEQACMPPQPQRPKPVVPRIFVSHSSKDNDFGLKLVQDLRKALGHDDAIWYDTAGGLYGGDAWWDKIKEELKARSVFIVVLSPDAMTSPWVQDEIRIAWRLKNSPAKKRIIPILHRECEVPEDLDTLQIISFLHPTPYERALNELLVALGLPTNSG